jgi:hypothetical protein
MYKGSQEITWSATLAVYLSSNFDLGLLEIDWTEHWLVKLYTDV